MSVFVTANMKLMILLILCLVGVIAAEVKEDCNACTTDDNPVCGRNSDGETKTFPNRCGLDVHNCFLETDYIEIGEGECSRKEECEFNCPEDYSLVCGRDSENETFTFKNECILRSYNCDYETDFEKISDGQCEGRSECDVLCPLDGPTPVCGRKSNGDTQTFHDGCSLRWFNCMHKTNFVEISEGECTKSDEDEECDFECTDNFSPVCGRKFDGERKTFNSSCALRLQNCKYETDYIQIKEGECKFSDECEYEYGANYSPVCAYNTEGNRATFINGCIMKLHNSIHNTDFVKIKEGRCQKRGGCDITCAEAESPVCGRNSTGETQTFSNKCSMQIRNCVYKTDFSLISNGNCTSSEMSEE